ncbi:MAG: intradiol ring-cleavage dioxygenase [Flavobacteriales bacterium]|nr:intradiol ring-cleavage dioxygenase [Flavobacteriales bacterium]
MKRKDFIRKGTIGLGTIIAVPTILEGCKKNDPTVCQSSPEETAGPFPIKTPADLINSNIVGDRTGIPLLINITVEDVSASCSALAGVYVDVWQCDAKGNYSEYSGQLDGDFTGENFLRGRQMTDESGKVSFVSIYPGWYPGRAPHIHLEVLKADGTSILISQIAFPEDISKTVYSHTNYNGDFDTKNKKDGIFKDSLALNMAQSVSGNNTDGYVLNKTIKVNG